MPTDSSARSCPQCRGGNLVEGTIRARGSHRFAPAGRFMWFGYEVRSGFACLDCGFVAHVLRQQELDEMKRRLAEG